METHWDAMENILIKGFAMSRTFSHLEKPRGASQKR